MNKEDQIIKQFLEKEPPVLAPENFTTQVMDTIMQKEAKTVLKNPGDWVYGLVAGAAILIGFGGYYIYDSQGMMSLFTGLRQFSTDAIAFHTLKSTITHWTNINISSVWLGILLIPVLLLGIDKLLFGRSTNLWKKANIFI